MLGEDDPTRAQPPTLSALFAAIRKNYFRLYLNFLYFNVGRIVYLQTDVVFPYLLLAPTIVAGKITLGAMNQILNAFSQVRTSFQYLVNSWSTIVELISIYQRLRAFESQIDGEPLHPDRDGDGPGIDRATDNRSTVGLADPLSLLPPRGKSCIAGPACTPPAPAVYIAAKQSARRAEARQQTTCANGRNP